MICQCFDLVASGADDESAPVLFPQTPLDKIAKLHLSQSQHKIFAQKARFTEQKVDRRINETSIVHIPTAAQLGHLDW